MHEEGDHATKNQLSGVLLQGDGLEERLEQWECILHDQHGRLLPQRLANGPLHHHHFAQIRRKEEAPLCEPTHVEKSATSKGATNPAPTTVPPIDSTANAIMNIGSTISWRPPH